MVDENMVRWSFKVCRAGLRNAEKKFIDNGFELTGEMLNATYYAITIKLMRKQFADSDWFDSVQCRAKRNLAVLPMRVHGATRLF
jgi:hypothetical protein